MKILGIYNMKGGVGKTTSAVNLACCARREGRVLLWDLDPQGAAGYALGSPGGEPGKGSRRMVRGRESLRSQIVATSIPLLDFIPSRFSYRKLDVLLSGERHPRSVLKRLLAPLTADYDWVILDCPPGIGLMSENVFLAVDILCVPLVPSPLSIHSFEEIVVFHQRKGLPRAMVLPFFSMVEQRRKTHRQIMSVFAAREGRVCTAFIPALAEIERMAVTRRPIAQYRPGSVGGQAYAALWAEIRSAASPLDVAFSTR